MSAAVTQDFATRTVADIAAGLPGSTAVFRRHKLDFCCGGGVRLSDAAFARGVSLPVLEAELGALVMPAEGGVPASSAELIALIQTRYHDVHRRELPELARLARRVEAVHRDKAECPHGLADRLETMTAELEDHMRKEEQVLFPMMVRGGAPGIGGPIAAMRDEHDVHGAHLKAIEVLTQGGTPPEGACNTWRALYAGIRKLEDDLMQHVHLENNVLFPRFGA